MFQAGVSWLFQRIVYAAEESLMLPKSIIFIGHYEHASSTQVFKLPCLFCTNVSLFLGNVDQCDASKNFDAPVKSA